MRGRFRLTVLHTCDDTLINTWNFYWKRRQSQPPAVLSRITPCRKCPTSLHTGIGSFKKGQGGVPQHYSPSLPQACIVSIKICRQWPSCSKQSCSRRVITVSIDGGCVLDMLEAIDVFFIWKLETNNTTNSSARCPS